MDTTGGLDGVVVGTTRLSRVRGDEGRLTYAGYEIDDLAANASFEQVCHLLWHGSLPDRASLDRLTGQIRAELSVEDRLLDVARGLAADGHPMAVLRTALSAAGCTDPDAADDSPESEQRKAIRMTAQAVTLTAAIGRFGAGLDVVAPDPEMGLAANLLYMLHGEQPDPASARALDVAFILHAEHGLNASTFAARIAAGTHADMHSAVVSGIATLKGPLHGGANEHVMRMLLDIGSVEQAGPWVRAALERGERIMGFGHRLYRTVDPRTPILEALARELQTRAVDSRWLDISTRVRDVMAVEMAERGRPVYPNVDLFSACVYYSLGIPVELFPNLFACARMPGWTAHIMEQRRNNNRLIAPVAEYIGPADRRVAPDAGRA